MCSCFMDLPCSCCGSCRVDTTTFLLDTASSSARACQIPPAFQSAVGAERVVCARVGSRGAENKQVKAVEEFTRTCVRESPSRECTPDRWQAAGAPQVGAPMPFRCLFLILVAASPAVAWAPFDSISFLLFGTPPLESAVTEAARPYPLDHVEHQQCHMELGGCMPAGGCMLRMGRCEAKVGHYWPVGEAEELPSFLRSFVPPIAPPYHMMTEKGIMEGRPNFWFTTYRMLASAPPFAAAERTTRRLGCACIVRLELLDKTDRSLSACTPSARVCRRGPTTRARRCFQACTRRATLRTTSACQPRSCSSFACCSRALEHLLSLSLSPSHSFTHARGSRRARAPPHVVYLTYQETCFLPSPEILSSSLRV